MNKVQLVINVMCSILFGSVPWGAAFMLTLEASAATVNFTGLSNADVNFSNTNNWDVVPVAGDTVCIAVTNVNGVATSAERPAKIDSGFSTSLGSAKIYSQYGFGTGMAYAEVAYGGLLKASNLYVGNSGNGAYDGSLILRSGGSVDTAANNSGVFLIGGETAGMVGDVVVEDGAALFRQSRICLGTYGTLTFELGTNSVSTLQTVRTTAGVDNTLNGLLRVDLARVSVAADYTLINSSSDNLQIAGDLATWLNGNGGSYSGTGSFSNANFEVIHGGDIQWMLSLTDNNRDVTLTVVPGTTRYVGEMNRFWRQQALVDRWLLGGPGIKSVPDYFYDHDFPYQSRPYSEEILFTDRLIIVRLLGGWAKSWTGGEANLYEDNEEADLFYRTETNTLAYRMELVAPRLDDYVAYGYEDLTIVLDNTPWTLPDVAEDGTYGNAAPPQYYSWFYWGVRGLIQTIEAEYGAEILPHLRFRMGTECQNPERFSGTQVDFHKLYDWAFAAVKEEIPSAECFPFNLAGGSSIETVEDHNVNYFELAEHCENGTNYASSGIGTPFDMVPMSLYFNPVWIDGELRRVDPDEYAANRIGVWDKIAADYPSLRFKRALHEFGIYGSEDGLSTGEPGARGCAQRFRTLVNLLEGGLDESSHWSVVERIPSSGGFPEYNLMAGEAWLYSIFDHLSWNPAYTLPVNATSTVGTKFKAMAVSTPSNTVLFVSSFNIERSHHDVVSCQVDVPKSLFQFSGSVDAQSVVYDRSTAIHDILRDEFDSAGILINGFENEPDTVSSVDSMAGANGYAYVRNNWSAIKDIMVDSLKLKLFPGTDLGDVYRINVSLETPSVIAIVLSPEVDLGLEPLNALF